MCSGLTENILGYQVRHDGFASCLGDIVKSIDQNKQRKWLACLNPHSYVVAIDNPDFQTALRAADWLVPDGAGIVLGSRILSGKIQQRITGPDIFYGLNNHMQESGGYSVFFLGSTEETLSAISERMSIDWPDVQIAGTFSPPFKSSFSDDDIELMVSEINAVKPDVLWVGMTAPKQEEWIHRVLPQLKVRFVAAIGAVFDFYTGRVKRSHPVLRRLGLEWLPRLLREPRRLWRRMFVSAPIFMWHVLLARLKPRQRD
jgi:N-acetylglucosaminyldiphosphoundecaprenol N-acetyl-beta-D-mannosaminyltransferase